MLFLQRFHLIILNLRSVLKVSSLEAVFIMCPVVKVVI